MKHSTKNFLFAAVAAFLFYINCTLSSPGATTNVLIGSGGLRFSPTNVVINAGDTVIWTWLTSPHSTTSGTNGLHGDDNGVPSGSWDSGVNSTGHTFTNPFPASGTFSYYCSVHFSDGMTGQVIVAAAPQPPSLMITNPLSGAVFAAPASVKIQAGVTNGSSAVTSVQFLEGTTVLANETTGPFSTTANNLAAGNYTLTAIAQDSSGLSATNSVGISVVTPVAVSLSKLFKFAATNFQFSYSVNTGLDYVIQRSTNLTTWVPVATNVAASNPIVFTDINATNKLDFYRVGLLPNP
jgi:plastocyanin